MWTKEKSPTSRGFSSSIDIPSVSQVNHIYQKDTVLYLVDDAVIGYTNTVTISAF
jgi:hypothetical protein